MMNEPNQGKNSGALPAIPVKRKRGRPRKDKSLNRVESAHLRKDQNLNDVKSARIPPEFGGVNGNRSHQVGSIHDPSDGMVGQVVTGLVEAVFDAGFLLAVKIGNSNTILRGVVFKPGHYVPVTAENDVAPRVQMIGRNELPKQNHTRVRGAKLRERKEKHVNHLGNESPALNELHTLVPQTANLVTSKGKYTAIVPAPSVHPMDVRGTVVPVVPQPINPSNGLPPANPLSPATSQAAQIMALKGNHVQMVTPISVYAPNSSTHLHQILAVTSEALASESHTDSQDKGVTNVDGPFNEETAEFQQGDEGKSMNSADMCVPSEVIEAQSSKAHDGFIKAGNMSPAKEDSNAVPEQDSSEMNEPRVIEPRRTVDTNFWNQSSYVLKTMGNNNRFGRMTELLQAVQENLNENQFRAEHQASCSKTEFQEQRISGTGLTAEEFVQAPNHSQAPGI